MNPPTDDQVAYSLEVVVRLTGLDAGTILDYQEQGLIRALPAADATARFDDEALRTLRQIEYLRSTCGVNEAGLRLIVSLMDEVEILRNELRARRQ